jgi:hypothetical protein
MEENPMLASKKTKRGVVGAVVLAGVLAVSGFAYTAALTVPAGSIAGSGNAVVTTPDVSGIAYTLDATDKSVLDAVVLTFDAALTVDQDYYISLDGTAGTWFSCGTAAASVTQTCTAVADETVASITDLAVTVVDN